MERARTIINHAPPEVKAAVDSGHMSINRAYVETQEARTIPAEIREEVRRNLTGADIVRCVAALDKRGDKTANLKQNQTEASFEASTSSGKSAAATAELLGVSRATVERARTVLDHAPGVAEGTGDGPMCP